MIIGLAELLRHRFSVEVEWTRKLVHFGGGIVCMAMPFCVRSHWVILFLAISMAVLFLVTRRLGWLQSIHDIKRKSRGSEYYPIVIYLLFLLAAHTPWKFVICVLVLCISDSVAAIIGSKWGRLKFRVEQETKSFEGSLAFFVATFVVVLIPLLIFKPQFAQLSSPCWHYFLASVLIGLLVTCFEAVSGYGRDNLFIPLGTWLVLTKTFQTDVSDVAMQNVSFVMILAVMVVLSRYSKSFHTGGAIVLCLASYGCWAMGSFEWALPVFIGYALYVVSTLTVELPWRLTIRPVVMNNLMPFLILVVGNIALNSGYPELTKFCFGPFLAACAVGLAQAITNVINWQSGTKKERYLMVGALVGTVCFALLTCPAVYRLSHFDWTALLIMAGVVIAISITSAKVLTPIPPVQASSRWYLFRMAFSLGAGVAIAIFQWLNMVQVWPVAV